MKELEHYQKTKHFFVKSDRERAGDYDATPKEPFAHTKWQRVIRREHVRLLKRSLSQRRGQLSVLDVGCGRGDFTMGLAGSLPAESKICGVEFYDEVLNIRSSLDACGLDQKEQRSVFHSSAL
jgi:ubiquinone/menaquinone biosynthesis C-methylase UbiE